MKATDAEIVGKYFYPPTRESIIEFVKEIGVSYSKFEVFYGIPYGTLKGVNFGSRDLPIKFWYIFHERIFPKDLLQFRKIRNQMVTKPVTRKERKTPSKDNRLVVIQ